MIAVEKDETYKKQWRDIKRLFYHGLEAVAPEKIIRTAIEAEDHSVSICGRSYALYEDRRIWVFGSGKASGRMAFELEQILGSHIYDGIVICPYGLKTRTRRIQQFEASHPVPDLNSLTATYELMDVAAGVRESDLVIYLMSGGSSSLLCMPPDELELDEIRSLYRQLLVCGAPIGDVNKIRKSVSRVKGGRLRPVFGQAVVEVLAISDVPGNDPAVIGSGPLVEETIRAKDALSLMELYQIDRKVPQNIIRFLEKESLIQDKSDRGKGNKKADHGVETDSPGSTQTDEDKNITNSDDTEQGENNSAGQYKTWYNIVASVEKVAEAVRQGAVSLGYNAWVHEGFMTGEARKIAKKISEEAVNLLVRDHPVPKPGALIYYGESTVTVKGDGKGGRNQEMALSAVIALEGQHHITFLSGGTDGRDGETNAAGAIGNAQTGLAARKMGVDPESYLENNDSWNFFNKLDGLLITGVTGNNLMDIQMVLIEK